jgi:hypothetical protein
VLALAVSLFASTGAVDAVAAGDGGSTRVTVTNASVHPTPLGAGAAGGPPAGFGTLGGYGNAVFLVQCLGGAGGHPPPPLEIQLDRQRIPLSVPALDFSEGAPALWLGSETSGAAMLGEALRAAGVLRVVRRVPAEVPTAFGALRFAPFILASAPDFAALLPAQRAAVEEAVAAGATLVLATGEGGVDAGLVQHWTGITLGEAAHPGPAARAAVPRAVAQRRLAWAPGSGAHPLLVADEAPLIVEAPWGLGRVRVLAVALDELEPGTVASTAFGVPPDDRGPVLSWLAAQPAMHSGAEIPFSPWVFVALAGLAGLGVVSRRAPRFAAASAVPLLGAALYLPPGGPPVVAADARVLLLPVGKGALALGAIDLKFGRGGAQTLDAGRLPVALEDALPDGGCLLVGQDRAAWALHSEPGSGARVRFVTWLEKSPEGVGTADGNLPAIGAGALSGAALERLTAAVDLPLGPAAGMPPVQAWRVVSRVASAPPPVVVSAPPSEAP